MAAVPVMLLRTITHQTSWKAVTTQGQVWYTLILTWPVQTLCSISPESTEGTLWHTATEVANRTEGFGLVGPRFRDMLILEGLIDIARCQHWYRRYRRYRSGGRRLPQSKLKVGARQKQKVILPWETKPAVLRLKD